MAKTLGIRRVRFGIYGNLCKRIKFFYVFKSCGQTIARIPEIAHLVIQSLQMLASFLVKAAHTLGLGRAHDKKSVQNRK